MGELNILNIHMEHGHGIDILSYTYFVMVF